MPLKVPTCHLPHISPGPHLGGRGPVGVAVVCVTAGASAGVWDCHVALLLVSALGLGQQLLPEPDLSGLGYSQDCGVKSLQLRVLPRSGQTVRFKVVGECGRTVVPTSPGCSGRRGPFPCSRNKRRGLLAPAPSPRWGGGSGREGSCHSRFPWSPREVCTGPLAEMRS